MAIEEQPDIDCDEWSLCMDRVHQELGVEKPQWW